MAEIIGEYGGMLGGGNLPITPTSQGIASPTTNEYGVPISTWESWSPYTRTKYLEDWNRTPAQQTYYQDKGFGYDLAYTYTGLIDIALGTDASEVGATTNQYIADTKQGLSDIAGTGAQIGTLALIVGAFYLLGQK